MSSKTKTKPINMELNIEHLAPYLPYRIEVSYLDYQTDKKRINAILTGISSEDGVETTYKRKRKGISGDLMPWKGNNNIHKLDFKPKLRPLSDLVNEVEDSIYPIEYFEENYPSLDLHKQCEMIMEDNRWINHCDYLLIQYLLKWHFDVFGLIEAGRAIRKTK